MKGELSVKVIRGTTGRKGYHLKDDCPTEHVEVQALTLALCEDKNKIAWARLLESNEIAKKLQSEFKATIQIGVTD